MRKGGLVRLNNYFGPGGPPPTLVLGLFWDVTAGVNIDLECAHAAALDPHLAAPSLSGAHALTLSRTGHSPVRHSSFAAHRL